MRRFLAAFALLLIATSAQAQSGLVPSSWKNQRGSLMHADWPILPNGFGGDYVNLAAGYPRGHGTPYPMSGTLDGSKISFSVVWVNPFENCHARTDWKGTISGNTIKTRWVITLEDGKVWKRGIDIFTRQ